MRIYLDNNATTAIHPDVLSTLDTMLRNVFGNASSIHKEGQTARQVIEDAREAVARLAGATAREVVFTSGGTESNNAAIFGAVTGQGHVVTTAIEPPPVAEAGRPIGGRAREVVSTSGGTESNTAAIFGAVTGQGHVVTTAIEHPSVAEAVRTLE